MNDGRHHLEERAQRQDYEYSSRVYTIAEDHLMMLKLVSHN